MALSVQSSAPTSSISVGNAPGGSISGVGSNYGLQGIGNSGYSSVPLSISVPSSKTATPITPTTGGTIRSSGVSTPTASPQGVADYNRSLTSSNNSISDAINSGASGYKGSILDYLDSRRGQQNTINSDAVQNELARQTGMQGILDMVGNGVRSTGTVLANKNAGSSSAGDAIARAYGTLGRQQASGVGNQFAQGQNKVNTEQSNLSLADTSQQRHSSEDKTNTINTIVNNARSQLASLNQAASYASIPNRVDIESKIAQVKQQAMAALSSYDSSLTQGISGQTPLDSNGVRAQATSLATAGTAPSQPFNYTSEAPAQFQGTGQFASSLPIFIAPKKQTS